MCAPEHLSMCSEFVIVLRSLLGPKILLTFPLAIWISVETDPISLIVSVHSLHSMAVCLLFPPFSSVVFTMSRKTEVYSRLLQNHTGVACIGYSDHFLKESRWCLFLILFSPTLPECMHQETLWFHNKTQLFIASPQFLLFSVTMILNLGASGEIENQTVTVWLHARQRMIMAFCEVVLFL